MRGGTTRRTKDEWLHFLRGRDLQQILMLTEEPLRGPVLEIGCGDGVITGQLQKRFDHVIPIDISPKRKDIDKLCIADAQNLPFPDSYFGFIFSSNVLEHVKDLKVCLKELRRVMKQEAIMIHTIPTPIWKILQVTLHPARLLRMFLRMSGIISPNIAANPKSNIGIFRSKKTGFKKKRISFLEKFGISLRVHGAASSHSQEFWRFRKEWWIRSFQETGFIVVRSTGLYFHSPYKFLPYKWLRLREFISNMGLCSVRAYWLRKKIEVD